VESQLIVAVEALGRHEIGPEVRSLGPFFSAPADTPQFQDFRRQVDRGLRFDALSRFALDAPEGTRLFLNVNPKLMVEHLNHRPGEVPWTLRAIDECGVDPRRIVIELTEEAVGGDTPSLRRLIGEYRARGCAIAVDDVGAEASNLDRIGYFEPDIIKIDALMLRRSLMERSFTEVLAGLRTIADGIGASLLFEGVESAEELDQAFRFGARYLQGWYFAKALPGFLPPDRFREVLRSRLRAFGADRAEEIAQRDHVLGTVVAVLASNLPAFQVDGDRVTLDPASLEPWRHLVCRVFVTDRAGFQVSPNYQPGDGGWRVDEAGLGSCRAARPYFAVRGSPNRGGARLWSVSDPYFDVNDGTKVRTYGRVIGPDLLLFADVPSIENPPPFR